MGAVATVGLLVMAYLVLRRRVVLEPDEASPWVRVIPALLGVGPVPFVGSLLLLGDWGVTYYFLITGRYEPFRYFGLLQERVIQISLRFASAYLVVVALVLILAALAGWLRTRSRLPNWSLVFLCIGSWMLIWRATRPLERWRFDTADFTAVATLALAFFFFWRLSRRRMTLAMLISLSTAALILCLLEAYGFLSDPFSPLLQVIPGIGSLFLALSLLLSIFGKGNYFGLNQESPGLPRWSRAFLFLGYALLAALFAHWETVIHRAGSAESYAETGFLLLGVPLVLATLLALRPEDESPVLN